VAVVIFLMSTVSSASVLTSQRTHYIFNVKYIHVKCLLFLSDFKQTTISVKDFSKFPKIKFYESFREG
jgi:hypothetical protein